MVNITNKQIIIHGSYEHNLKNINATAPKDMITVFTRVSGSDKSSLIFNIIAAKLQYQLNRTFLTFVHQHLPHYGQTDIDAIENRSSTIIIDQQPLDDNDQTIVGITSDIYTLSQLLYSRLSNSFVSYVNEFFHNHPTGICPCNQGQEVASAININVLTGFSRSFNERTICFPTFAPGIWCWKRYTESDLLNPDKKKGARAECNGLDVIQTDLAFMDPVMTCGETCQGQPFNPHPPSWLLDGKTITAVMTLQVSVVLTLVDSPLLQKRVTLLDAVSLEYLTASQPLIRLSTGESLPLKLTTELVQQGEIFVFNKPTTGLHPSDTACLMHLFQQLVNAGNTVLIIKHNLAVICQIGWIIDLESGSSKQAGQQIFSSPPAELITQRYPITDKYLHQYCYL